MYIHLNVDAYFDQKHFCGPSLNLYRFHRSSLLRFAKENTTKLNTTLKRQVDQLQLIFKLYLSKVFPALHTALSKLARQEKKNEKIKKMCIHVCISPCVGVCVCGGGLFTVDVARGFHVCR